MGDELPINIGSAAREIRNRLGLSLRDAASQLEMSYTFLSNVENGKASPSPETIERFYKAWGIDLYMYALVFHSDNRATPKSLEAPLRALLESWEEHVEEVLSQRTDQSKSC